VTTPSSSAAQREHHIAVRRSARFITIGEPSEQLREIWIACHGYGQLARTFARSLGEIADPARYLVAPEALSRYYLDPPSPPREDPSAPRRVGASWMTREDREHEIEDQIAYLDAVHDQILAERRRDATRLVLLGFSQGVATIARWLVRGTARPDEAVFWAGSLPPEIEPAAVRDRLAGVRLTMVLGRGDPLGEWTGLDRTVAAYRAAGLDAHLLEFEGGHTLDAGTLRRLAGEIAARAAGR
jgi:predicted esterase